MVLSCWLCGKQIYTNSYYTKYIWKDGKLHKRVTLHWECVIKLLNKYNTTVVTLDILKKEGVI